MRVESDTPIRIERCGATAVIILNRPAKRNAIDIPMRQALGHSVADIRDDPEIKAVVVTGAEQNFSGGGDLTALSAAKLNPWQSRERIRDLHRWFREFVNLEKPVIAAVDGVCYGAGFNLSLAADFILCTQRATFCAVFQRIGVLPDLGGLFLLPRIVGLQRAKELIFSARVIDAQEALSLGIVFDIRPAETLMEDALALAAQFHSASTESLGMAKSILNQSFHLDQHALAELEASHQAIAFDSDYHADAVKRFEAREAPTFSWKLPWRRAPRT
jgi:2-(1,2-epoxy-1,2-dihydrophenyl)acetyl-CoA isomerase